ncbi:hypothetical protein F5887DRAFT_919929 [Amanita rubescens]|nr:hypothetical protein F5887DRAFT_919929 [Amanita rubescens]
MSNRLSNPTSVPLPMPTTITDTLMPTLGYEDSRCHSSTGDGASTHVAKPGNMQTAIPPDDRDHLTSHFSAAVEKGLADESHRLLDKQYESLIKRFNMKVTLSTFACTLIVTYYALVNAIVTSINKRHIGRGIPFNVGLLLSFIAIGFHAGSAIVAGRAAVLCSDPHLKKDPRPEDYFPNILATCEHLDLDGTIVFVLAMFETSFLLFDSYIYPGVFCAVSVAGLAVFFAGKYREMSLMYKDFILAVEICSELTTIVLHQRHPNVAVALDMYSCQAQNKHGSQLT